MAYSNATADQYRELDRRDTLKYRSDAAISGNRAAVVYADHLLNRIENATDAQILAAMAEGRTIFPADKIRLQEMLGWGRAA